MRRRHINLLLCALASALLESVLHDVRHRHFDEVFLDVRQHLKTGKHKNHRDCGHNRNKSKPTKYAPLDRRPREQPLQKRVTSPHNLIPLRARHPSSAPSLTALNVGDVLLACNCHFVRRSGRASGTNRTRLSPGSNAPN